MRCTTYDAVVIGAGFAGIRALLELRRLGLSATLLEAGTDVGGTWYWNRYPGARTDSESWSYCFPFPELEAAWAWSERYPSQPEVQAYLRRVIEIFELREHIEFGCRIVGASYDDIGNEWTVAREDGTSLTTTFLVTGLGQLSIPHVPAIPGLDTFEGETYVTGRWPQTPVEFAGKSVGIIGAGASAVQAIPEIAKTAAHLTVFQRTPNFVMPAMNHRLTDDQIAEIRANYPAIWEQARRHFFGFPMKPAGRVYDDVNELERECIFEEGWARGGFQFVFETFDDLLIDARSNDAAAEFVRRKIRDTVRDPSVANLLCPTGYPYGAKRPPAGHGYYETFNRDNVEIVDVLRDPIQRISRHGVVVGTTEHRLDMLVIATGFDAATGAYTRMDIRGVGGQRLSDVWKAGPQSVFGIAIPSFPNLFMVGGPQCAYANIPIVIEAVVGWLRAAIQRMREEGSTRMVATAEAAEEWTSEVQRAFDGTLLPRGGDVGSWYLGANIENKPRRPLFFFGGCGAYSGFLAENVAQDFPGFRRETPADRSGHRDRDGESVTSRAS